MIDESSEHDVVETSVSAAFRVNWFQPDRPVAGTTFWRQPMSRTDSAESAEDMRRVELGRRSGGRRTP